MIRSNTGCDGDLEILRLGKTLCGEVTRVEPASVRGVKFVMGISDLTVL